MDLFKTLYRLRIIPFIKKWNILNIGLGILDVAAITIAFQCAYLLNYSEVGGLFIKEKTLLYIYLGIAPTWLLLLYFINVTQIPRTKRYRVLFFEYLQSALIVGLILVIIYFVFRLHPVSRRFMVEVCFFGFLLLFSIRFIEYKVFKFYRRKGYNYRNVVFIADESAVPFIESLFHYREWGYKVLAIFTESQKLNSRFDDTVFMSHGGKYRFLDMLMGFDNTDEVFYFKKKVVTSEIQDIIRYCEELGITFHQRFDKSENTLTNAIENNLAGEYFLTFTNIPHNKFMLAAKRFLDIAVSLFMILLFLPLFLIIALLIKLTSSGPVIFRQERVGLRGRKFNLYKFRTMVVNAEEMKKELEDRNEVDGPVFKIWDDPRATRIGKLLRRTGFDELPQLFNVLSGEMSLVGPRPPLHNETLQYKRWQLRRLSVRPGLLCFWQVQPDRSNIKFEKWMEMDLAYIDNWSLRLDILIMIRTLRTLFKRTHF